MHKNNSSQAPDALLRLPQVLSLIPVSRSGWWAGVAEGRYPRPIKLSPRVTVWRALPRVVVPNDADIAELDLSLVAGLECTVAHKGEDRRALDVAELAIRSGATVVVIHDQSIGKTSLTTNEIKAIRGIQ